MENKVIFTREVVGDLVVQDAGEVEIFDNTLDFSLTGEKGYTVLKMSLKPNHVVIIRNENSTT